MKLKLWQVDAFASRHFEGNPAAIVPLESWLPDEKLQAIAEENNLSKTAYFIHEGEDKYALRWFTPTTEVDLCGHATLASAFVVINELATNSKEVTFSTRSGELKVTKHDDGLLSMSLPADKSEPIPQSKILAEKLGAVLGVAPPTKFMAADICWQFGMTVRRCEPFGPQPRWHPYCARRGNGA